MTSRDLKFHCHDSVMDKDISKIFHVYFLLIINKKKKILAYVSLQIKLSTEVFY